MATRLGQPLDAVELTHDGETIVARRGEPLVLSLLAADRLLLSRSPKLHRPRGPFCLRGACEGCLVRVSGLPNQAACRVLVAGGEVVETQNVLGTRQLDLLAASDFLFPHGIDHHRLMAGVRGVSPIVSNVARRIAGLGKLADHAPKVAPAQRLEVPLLIVGGGPSGLRAAIHWGSKALLVDDGIGLGGALTALDPPAAEALASAAQRSGAALRSRAAVVALSREPEDGSGHLTALVVGEHETAIVRARAVLLAPGEHDRAPCFPNNDLPGIFSARAALWAWRGDVLLGRKLALVGAGPYARVLAEQLRGVVELFELDASSVLRAIGRDRISAVEVQTEQGRRKLKVDALAFDGPGAPSFELFAQAGAEVDFDPAAGYVPRVAETGSVAPRVFAGRAYASPALASLLG